MNRPAPLHTEQGKHAVPDAEPHVPLEHVAAPHCTAEMITAAVTIIGEPIEAGVILCTVTARARSSSQTSPSLNQHLRRALKQQPAVRAPPPRASTAPRVKPNYFTLSLTMNLETTALC